MDNFEPSNENTDEDLLELPHILLAPIPLSSCIDSTDHMPTFFGKNGFQSK